MSPSWTPGSSRRVFRTRRTQPVVGPYERLPDGGAAWHGPGPGGQERGAALPAGQRGLGVVPSSGDGTDRTGRRLAVAVAGSAQLECARARPRGPRRRLVGLRPDRDRPSADGDAQGVAAGRTATRYLRPRHWKQTATRCGCGRAELHAGNRDSSAGRRCSSGASESSQVSQPAMTSDRPTHRSPAAQWRRRNGRAELLPPLGCGVHSRFGCTTVHGSCGRGLVQRHKQGSG